MKINYRPADMKKELRPIVEKFFKLYELIGPEKVRVEPSIDELTPGIGICPEKGSVIEEICTLDVPETGQLVRSGKGYVTIDIGPEQRCLVQFEYMGPWTRA